MAVTRQENVIRVDADNDTISDSQYVESILYIPGTGSPTAQIKKTDTSGMVLWEAAGSSRINDQMPIRLKGTTHFDLAGTGTVLYLYLCSE